jgi:hypothetical protein
MIEVGNLVNVTEQRGTGTFYRETPLGLGVVLDVEKTDDLNFAGIGPFNLGDNVIVYLCSSAEVKYFTNRSLEVIQ